MADMTRNPSEPMRSQREFSGERAASRALEDAKAMGNELFAAVRDTATTLFDEQRRRAADEVVAIGDALRQSGEALDRDAGIGVGRYADEAARAIRDFADGVRSRSWSELAGDLDDFARRWPYAFLAGAFAAGLVGGRLLLSAPPREREPELPHAMPGTAARLDAPVGAEMAVDYAPGEKG